MYLTRVRVNQKGGRHEIQDRKSNMERGKGSSQGEEKGKDFVDHSYTLVRKAVQNEAL